MSDNPDSRTSAQHIDATQHGSKRGQLPIGAQFTVSPSQSTPPQHPPYGVTHANHHEHAAQGLLEYHIGLIVVLSSACVPQVSINRVVLSWCGLTQRLARARRSPRRASPGRGPPQGCPPRPLAIAVHAGPLCAGPAGAPLPGSATGRDSAPLRGPVLPDSAGTGNLTLCRQAYRHSLMHQGYGQYEGAGMSSLDTARVPTRSLGSV